LQKTVFAALGLKLVETAELPKLLLLRWKDLSRWSVSYNQQVQAGMDLSHGRYPVVTLGSILTMVQYGTSQKANSEGRGTPILRINNIKDGQIDTGDLKHLELTDRELKSLRLEDGDILIIRTSGSRDLVGTCAVFRGTDPFVFASYLIRLRVDQAQADSSYVAWVINSPIGRQQINAISRQIMQNNINSEEIRSLEIPLPPLDVQRKIMAEVQAGLAEIAQLRESAKVQADAARAEVERMIIGTR
jgi:restriction endonuclease S subunit